MMAFLKEYIINIATISIVFILLEILIPSSKIKKFIGLISGFVLIIAIIKPMVGILNKDLNFKDLQAFNSQLLKQKEMEYNNKIFTENQNKKILEAYKEKLKECVLGVVKEVDSSLQATCEVIVNENSESKSFGAINKVNIKLIKKLEKSNPGNVEAININEKSIQRNVEEEIDKRVEDKIKEEVSSSLGITADYIVLNKGA